MKLHEFIRLVNDIAERNFLVEVHRHIIGKMLVTEAKPLGFGTKDAMIKLHKGGWVVVDPRMCKVVNSGVKF